MERLIGHKQEDKVMKEKEENKSRIIGLRLSPKEYAQVQKKSQKSTPYKLSEYVRRRLFEKPFTVYHRNQSLDELMVELIELRKEMNGIGNNFNQAVKKLHTLSQIPEFRSWLLTWELDQKILFGKVEEIRKMIDKISDVWLQ
jgi:hypothetical protein